MAQLSRRSIMGGVAALPFIAAPIAAEGMAMTTTPDRTAWDQAFAAYQRAQAASEAFSRDQYDPAHAAELAEIGDGPELIISYAWKGETLTYQTSETAVEKWVKGIGNVTQDESSKAHRALWQRIEAHRERREAIRQKYRLDTLWDRCAELENETARLYWHLVEKVPAPDFAALAWKMAAIKEATATDEQIDMLVAEARRLGAMEARNG